MLKPTAFKEIIKDIAVARYGYEKSKTADPVPDIEYKYIKPKTVVTYCHVYYKVVDKDDKILHQSGYGGKGMYASKGSACFSSIFGSLNKDSDRIIIIHPREKIPYEDTEINRWINDLNEMGFPCKYLGVNAEGQSEFELKISDFQWKVQLNSTMTLIRNLYEGINNGALLPEKATIGGSCLVPEIYFQQIDENPDMDKFEALQNAHKHPKNPIYGGHNVTGHGGGVNVESLDDLQKRFAATKSKPLGGRVNYSLINNCWNGGLDMKMLGKKDS